MSTLPYIPIALLICDKALVKLPAASAVNDNCISYSPCIRYKSTSSAAHEQLTTEYQNCKQIPQDSENKSVSFQHSTKKRRHSSHINFSYILYNHMKDVVKSLRRILQESTGWHNKQWSATWLLLSATDINSCTLILDFLGV